LYELKWLSFLDREYLEDYEQKEREEYDRLVVKKIEEGKFDFEKDRYPPDERFVKLQKPVVGTTLTGANYTNIWSQVPFCGSLIINLPSYPRDVFEKRLFKTSDIPKIIDFVKETGRLQVAFNDPMKFYKGLDFLDPFFEELEPPRTSYLPPHVLGTQREIRNASYSFVTLANIRLSDYFMEMIKNSGRPLRQYEINMQGFLGTYVFLKLGGYAVLEDIQNLMVDDPRSAMVLLNVCLKFIQRPLCTLRYDSMDFSFEDVGTTKVLPIVYRPQNIRFPCEIGKFLLKRLTYAAQDMRACYELMDHYDAYDLRKVQESLNEGIVTNHPDIINKNREEFSQILDNVWNDPSVPRQIKNLKRGLPMSIAAMGTAVSAFTGGIEGFLAGLGFSVGTEFLKAEIEGLSERIVKFFSRSYQANVYDFKKKYKHRIVHTQKKEQD